jgi:hypothetical protein
MQSSNPKEPSASVLADLSALADGSIDPAREPAIRELIAESPELRERYDRERWAIAALHATRGDRAPARLRARIEAQRSASGPTRGGWLVGRGRLAYGGAAAVVAAVALAVVLLLPGGTPGGPSVSQAAALALRGSVHPAPPPDPGHPDAKLARDVEEVYFPNWAGRFHLRAVGMRTDRLDGRLALTVYYARASHPSQLIAYTILAAPALARPGTPIHHVNATDLQQLTVGKRMVVTWRRANHTCVLSGTGVSWAELSKLAAWEPAGLES